MSKLLPSTRSWACSTNRPSILLSNGMEGIDAEKLHQVLGALAAEHAH